MIKAERSLSGALSVCRKSPAGAGLFLIDMVEWTRVMKMLERGKMDRDLVEFVVIDQLVPKEHLLRKIDAAVDFTQLYEMVEPLYCEDNGRPSIDPVVLFKMVLVPGVRDPVLSGATNRFLSENRKPIDRIS